MKQSLLQKNSVRKKLGKEFKAEILQQNSRERKSELSAAIEFEQKMKNFEKKIRSSQKSRNFLGASSIIPKPLEAIGRIRSKVG